MDKFRARALIFAGVVLVALAILGLRLAQLQLVDRDEYAKVARGNAVRPVRVQPARGAVYDREGVLMVDNAQAYTVTLTPQYFDRSKVSFLADLLEVPDSVVLRKLADAREWSIHRPSASFPEVSYEIFSRVQERQYELPGVGFALGQKRHYSTRARAAHALGYIREITDAELARQPEKTYRMGDQIGQTGLERLYEPYLRGRVGRELGLVDSRGTLIGRYKGGARDVQPFGGYGVHLTLDSQLQAFAESLFVNKRGAAVALDPETGGILAMVSAPDYDPEAFSKPMDPDLWAYLTTSPVKPMFNRATMMGLPPGSTWKPFMALVGLQEGVISPTSIYHDRGGYTLGRRVFSNHAGHVYGPINVQDAIRVSSNAFFFNVMMGLDVDTFKKWATRFGFGVPVPMDIPEQSAGLIPDSSYYNRTYPRGWTSGYTINLGIGQGDMVVTPMQMARYVAAVANGGTLYSPHLVLDLVHPKTGEVLRPAIPAPEEIPIKDEYFGIVREGMRQVMEAGTGYYVQIPGIASGGKTGTAENPHGKDHSIFIIFAPFDDPKIAIAVMVENAGFGATVAGPIASLMAEQYLTGRIATTPQRRAVLRRALSARSEPLPESDSE